MSQLKEKPKDVCKNCNFKWDVCPYYKIGICTKLNIKTKNLCHV